MTLKEKGICKMGDRGAIKIVYDCEHPVYFYTHWEGSNLPIIVKRALAKQKRWDDEAYFARIVFCELVKNDIEDSTGFGISPYLIESEYPIIEINCAEQEIRFIDQDDENSEIFKWSFEEYLATETGLILREHKK